MQTRHPIVKFDLDPALLPTFKGRLAEMCAFEIKAYAEALQQEVRSADFAVARYRVTIEAVPEGEEPIVDPDIEYREGS